MDWSDLILNVLSPWHGSADDPLCYLIITKITLICSFGVGCAHFFTNGQLTISDKVNRELGLLGGWLVVVDPSYLEINWLKLNNYSRCAVSLVLYLFRQSKL